MIVVGKEQCQGLFNSMRVLGVCERLGGQLEQCR